VNECSLPRASRSERALGGVATAVVERLSAPIAECLRHATKHGESRIQHRVETVDLKRWRGAPSKLRGKFV
jgi:hypothetical protein